MKLIECTAEDRPADFLLVAQNQKNYLVLGFSSVGEEYTGDFSFYHARFGTSNELGMYTSEEFVTSNDTIKEQFNTNQDKLRMAQYRKRTDHLAAESHRKTIDSSVSADDRDAANAAFLAEVAKIKAEFPKV